MKRTWTLAGATSTGLILCCGCASVVTHTQQGTEGKGVYSGVRADAWLLSHPNSEGDAVVGHISPFIIVPCTIIDLPLSAALDTLLLPIDLTYDPAADKTKRPHKPQQ